MKLCSSDQLVVAHVTRDNTESDQSTDWNRHDMFAATFRKYEAVVASVGGLIITIEVEACVGLSDGLVNLDMVVVGCEDSLHNIGLLGVY